MVNYGEVGQGKSWYGRGLEIGPLLLERQVVESTKQYIIEEYKPELDAISPQLKDMQYPVLMIVAGEQIVLYDYPSLDALFNRIVSVVAKQKKRKK